MYLSTLSKEEKEMFLGIAYNLASIDGDYSYDEQVMMKEYCREMNVEFDEESMIKSSEELIEKFKLNSDEKVKKIVIFETTGLAMADGHYDDCERELIKLMEKEFELESGFADKCESVLIEYFSFQKRVNQLILG